MPGERNDARGDRPDPPDEIFLTLLKAELEKEPKLDGLFYGYFCLKGVPTSGAEDLVQQTFLEALKSCKTFDSSRELRPWLWTIAHRQCFKWLGIPLSAKTLPVLCFDFFIDNGVCQHDSTILAGKAFTAIQRTERGNSLQCSASAKWLSDWMKQIAHAVLTAYERDGLPDYEPPEDIVNALTKGIALPGTKFDPDGSELANEMKAEQERMDRVYDKVDEVRSCLHVLSEEQRVAVWIYYDEALGGSGEDSTINDVVDALNQRRESVTPKKEEWVTKESARQILHRAREAIKTCVNGKSEERS